MNNNAIIFITTDEEKRLARTPYLGGNLLIHTIKILKKVKKLSNIYVIGAKQGYPGTLRRNNVKDVIGEIGKSGKTILTSPLYPELAAEDYEKLLNNEKACVATCSGKTCEAFMIPNEQLGNFEHINYEEIEIKNSEKYFEDYPEDDNYNWYEDYRTPLDAESKKKEEESNA